MLWNCTHGEVHMNRDNTDICCCPQFFWLADPETLNPFSSCINKYMNTMSLKHVLAWVDQLTEKTRHKMDLHIHSKTSQKPMQVIWNRSNALWVLFLVLVGKQAAEFWLSCKLSVSRPDRRASSNQVCYWHKQAWGFGDMCADCLSESVLPRIKTSCLCQIDPAVSLPLLLHQARLPRSPRRHQRHSLNAY